MKRTLLDLLGLAATVAAGVFIYWSQARADVLFSNPTPVQSTDRVSKTGTLFDWTGQRLTISYAVQNPVETVGGGSASIPFSDLPNPGKTAVAQISDVTDRFLAGRLAAPSYTPPAPNGTVTP